MLLSLSLCCIQQKHPVRRCSAETAGLLYWDAATSRMYRCQDGQWTGWQHYHDTHTRRQSAATPHHAPAFTASSSSSRRISSGGIGRASQSSVRRAASTPLNSADTAVCPAGISTSVDLIESNYHRILFAQNTSHLNAASGKSS